MKKIVVIAAMAVALSAASAFAISTSPEQAPATLKGFNPTNNVNTWYIGNSATPINAWAATSAHISGDKEYWTSSAFGGIAYKPLPAPGSSNGKTPSGAPQTPTDSTVASGYTTM